MKTKAGLFFFFNITDAQEASEAGLLSWRGKVATRSLQVSFCSVLCTPNTTNCTHQWSNWTKTLSPFSSLSLLAVPEPAQQSSSERRVVGVMRALLAIHFHIFHRPPPHQFWEIVALLKVIGRGQLQILSKVVADFCGLQLSRERHKKSSSRSSSLFFPSLYFKTFPLEQTVRMSEARWVISRVCAHFTCSPRSARQLLNFLPASCKHVAPGTLLVPPRTGQPLLPLMRAGNVLHTSHSAHSPNTEEWETANQQ